MDKHWQIVLPDEERENIRMSSWTKIKTLPFLIYVDFEYLLDERPLSYRGVAHSICNPRYAISREIPIVIMIFIW